MLSVDINIGGIGLNDALCPNNYVLEEFENSLYDTALSVISGNALEPLIELNPNVNESVVELVAGATAFESFPELVDDPFLNHVSMLQSLIDSKLELNDSESKSSAQKISKHGKFLGVNVEAYQSRLDSCKVLIMDELSKGDKLDLKKLQLLEAKRTNLENSIQAIENGRNSIIGSTQRDPYLQRHIDEILATVAPLNVS